VLATVTQICQERDHEANVLVLQTTLESILRIEKVDGSRKQGVWKALE